MSAGKFTSRMNKVTIGLWATAVVVGFVFLWDYSNAPGVAGKPPKSWPKNAFVELTEGYSTLLIFAHPKCSCTEATFSELQRMLPHILEKVKIHVVFYHPHEFDLNWVKSDLFKLAQSLPIQSVIIDSKKQVINQFRPKTSGQVYLYSQNGDLVYSGGITPSRGHEGDSEGKKAVYSWVLESKLYKPTAFVFGCSLFHNGEGGSNKTKTLHPLGGHDGSV